MLVFALHASFLHRFLGSQSMPENLSETRDEKQTFFNACRVTRKFPARRSFALEQLSTNTKSTQHQTAELSEGPSSLQSIFSRAYVTYGRSYRKMRFSVSRYVSIGVPGRISNKYTRDVYISSSEVAYLSKS